MTRLATWASPADDAHPQLGITYSDGIWMSLTPVTDYDPGVVRFGELLPVEQAFSKHDFPERLQTLQVRGHVAWAKEVSPGISCEPGLVEAVPLGTGLAVATNTPSPDVTGGTPAAVMFAPNLNGTLTWLEHSYVVEIAGPYSLSFLMPLAEDMTW